MHDEPRLLLIIIALCVLGAGWLGFLLVLPELTRSAQ